MSTLGVLVFLGPEHAAAAPEPALRVRHEARRGRLSFEYGPVTLSANVNYSGTLVPVSVTAAVPIDGWLRSFSVELVDAQGHRIKQPLLHHAGLFAPTERDLFSPAMRRIVAFGSETETIRLPGELGYRVEKGDSVLMLAALFNATARTHEGVFLRISMDYADARRDRSHLDVLPLYLDVLPPGGRMYDVPPGGSKRSWDWSPAISGRVLALGGHLHKYGQKLVLEDVTTGDTLWTGSGSYDEEGELTGVSRKIYLRGLRLEREHVYRLTAVYDNPTGEVVRGAMGKIGGVFLPDRLTRMAADRTDADYLRDWQAMVQHSHEMDHVKSTEQRVTNAHKH
jgi:hypothetical protein